MDKVDHLVIFRTGGSVLNIQSYNCQEIGLAKALTRRGVKVSVIMAGTEEREEIIEVGQSVINVFFLTFTSFNQALSCFNNWENTLDHIKPSHIQIHEFGMWMSYKVSKWAQKHQIPVYLIQGVYQTTPKPFFRTLEKVFNKTFGKYVLKNAKAIGCKSFKASDYVKQYYNKVTSQVYIGLDDSKFQKSLEKDWRGSLNIKDKKVLLYVGKIEERRNPLFLLDIVKQLPDDYVLILVGVGPQSDMVEDAIKNNCIDNRVFMLGKMPQSDLYSVYAAADLFLLASSYEIYGMVIMESMYFGVPVISSHTGGAEIIIDDQTDGIIVDEFDTNSWIKRIKNICENEKKRQSMKDKARKKIETKFLWDKAVETFLSLYCFS